MKKIISTCLLLFFIAFIFSTQAQKRVTTPSDRSTAQEFRKVQFGLGLGLNASTLVADWGINSTSQIGLNFGTYVKFRFIKLIGFQPGVQISTQGINFEEDVSINLAYIQVPIVLKIYAFRGLNFDVGPQIGVLTYAKFYNPITDEKDDWMDMFTPVDVALRLGINYEFNFGLCITTHYNMGLTNVNDADDRSEFPVKNGVFQLGVAYYF